MISVTCKDPGAILHVVTGIVALFDGSDAVDETLRFVEEKLHIGMFRWDLPDRHRWSDGLYALLGLEPGSLEPSDVAFEAMVHPEDRRVPADFLRLVESGLPWEREFRIVRRNGRVRWLRTRGEVIIGSNAKPARVIGVVVDATAGRKEREAAMLDSTRLQAVTKSGETAQWTVRIDRADTMDADVVLEAMRVRGRLHPEDRARTVAAWQVALQNSQPFDVQHRILAADGRHRWHRSCAMPVAGGNVAAREWAGLSFDIDAQTSSRTMDPDAPLSGAQIRGARGMLNWSVRDLAEAAKVSSSIIRRLEEVNGISAHPDDPIPAIRAAFETAGIEFITSPDGRPALGLR